MTTMAINRRKFLQSLAGAGLLPVSLLQPLNSYSSDVVGSIQYLSAYDGNGKHFIGGLGQHGQLVFSHQVQWRGHGFALHPLKTRAIAFARRPGIRASVINIAEQRVVSELHTVEGRHFYGHGCYSPDGQYFYATENDYEAGRGVIGIWRTHDGVRLNEFPSYGIGPHDVHLMPDGDTLVVANGGIRTHPDYGRRKLNIDAMDSSLAYIDLQSGSLIERHRVPYSYLSIRHLYVNARGTVAIAMQSEQPSPHKKSHEPLLAIHRMGSDIRCLLAGPDIQPSLKGYAADTYISDDETRAVLTCPRADRALVWDMRTERVHQQITLAGVSGLAPVDSLEKIFFTSASGRQVNLSMKSGETGIIAQQLKWDNHCISTS